ncbi:MAG: metalloregulator ArsR/SmtB family transcription factor [Nitrospirota bacterium]
MNDFKGIAELLKVVAHPARLEILQKLEAEILCVSDMEEILGVGQSNVSQHLSILRRSGLVDCYMDGKLRCYFLKDPRVLDILTLLKKKYNKLLPAPACCPVRPHAQTKRAVV